MGTFSTNLLLSLLAFGESAANGFDNWGESANSNFSRLDAKLGNKTSHSLAAGDVTLSATAESSLFVALTGTIIADRTVNISDRPGFWMISNDTVGDFTVTMLPSGGAGVEIPKGVSLVYSDGAAPLIISGGRGEGDTIFEEYGTTLSSATSRDITGISAEYRSFEIEGNLTSITSNLGVTNFCLSVGNGSTWFDIPSSAPLVRWSNSGTTARYFFSTVDVIDNPALAVCFHSKTANELNDPFTAFVTPAQYPSRPITALRFKIVPPSGSTTVNIAALRVRGLR